MKACIVLGKLLLSYSNNLFFVKNLTSSHLCTPHLLNLEMLLVYLRTTLCVTCYGIVSVYVYLVDSQGFQTFDKELLTCSQIDDVFQQSYFIMWDQSYKLCFSLSSIRDIIGPTCLFTQLKLKFFLSYLLSSQHPCTICFFWQITLKISMKATILNFWPGVLYHWRNNLRLKGRITNVLPWRE